MGNDPNNFVSESQSRFVKHPPQNNGLTGDRKKALAGASLELGADQRDFSTQYRGTYANRFLENQRCGLSQL